VPGSSSLKPRRIKSRADSNLSSWCLNVPPALSPTGKRQRLFFKTEKDGKAEAEKLTARRDRFGNSLAGLHAAKIVKAAKAFELLEPHNVDLLDAVTGFLEIHKQRTESISFHKLCTQYIAAKSNRDERHLNGLRQTRERFPSLHEKLVSDIDHRTLEPLVNAIVPGGRNLVLRHLRAFFNFGIKRGYLQENPIKRLEFVEIERKEVEIVPPAKVSRMLAHALRHDLELLPFLTLGFFTGIRPEELRLLQWSDVDLADKAVTIRPEVSKTKRRRFPELSGNAVKWLEAYSLRGGKTEGPIVTLAEDALYEHRRLNREAAKVTHWPNSGMRHTFCSCWLAIHKDVNRLVLLSGHDSPDTMWRHYHRGIAEAEAKRFWSIIPRRRTGKIIQFKRAAANG
jgi:integrase